MIRLVATVAVIVGATFVESSPSRAIPLSSAAPQPVAVITQIDGEVFLQRGRRKAEALRSTTFLYVGDSVQAGVGSAVIYQVYAPVFRLTAKKARKITLLSPPPPEGAVTPEDFAWYRKHYASALRNQNHPSKQTQGGPDEDVFLLISPRHSVVLSGRPTFEWTPLKGAAKYEVRVYDMRSKPIWRAETEEPQMKFPENIDALTQGSYKLDVSTRVNNRRFYDATEFSVVTGDDADKMRSALERAKGIVSEGDANNLIYIAALVEYRQYPLAEKEIRDALRRTPQDQSLWTLLMQVYQEMKLWDYREKARALKSNPNQPTVLRQLLDR